MVNGWIVALVPIQTGSYKSIFGEKGTLPGTQTLYLENIQQWGSCLAPDTEYKYLAKDIYKEGETGYSTKGDNS